MNNQLIISDFAAARIAEMLKTEGQNKAFRITVEGGGCSGFKYNFDFTEIAHDDVVENKNGAVVVTDATSLEFLKGSELQYIQELGGAYFAMKNPNAKASCGCGTSFAV